jgi:hypothetical protein
LPKEGRYVTLEEYYDIADTPEYSEWRQYQVDYPEDGRGPFYIKHYEIARLDEGRARWIDREGVNRDPGWGTFRKLIEMKEPGTYDPDVDDDHILWMSDTQAEILEHKSIIDKLQWCREVPHMRVLINGLGLGLIARAASLLGAEHIDVVELNPYVAELIGQFMPSNVTVHIGDAYEMRWPYGARWDLAWHDIWPEINDENLTGMDLLTKKYRNRVGWQDCWQKKGCQKMKRFYDKISRDTTGKYASEVFEVLGGKFEL